MNWRYIKSTTLSVSRGRGLGVDIAKAALAAAHQDVATGRNKDKVANIPGVSEKLSRWRLSK